MPEIISRKEAINRGLHKYFTGKPCKNGHVNIRVTSTHNCVECKQARTDKWRKTTKYRNPRVSVRRSDAKRREQLGMSVRAASIVLIRALVFELSDKVCFRCGEAIHDSKDYTLDHKEPWIDSADPKKLFFDVKNIALSHSICNIRAGRRNIKV